MSSMLRQHHVKIQDLVNFLRGYDPAKPQSAEDWSKQESSGFEPGMLLFCLERVSAPSGLAFGKKDSEGETYRVKDLCVVVGRDNNRSLVVNITASAFELRYLEVLMLEKARKAILDGKDFLYVAVKPAQPLGDAKLREIEELGAMYAQGGSRRSLVVDASGPQEPAVALLAALGVKLSIGGIGKQVLDIGSICHMLFAPDGRQEDKNKAIVKSCFTAIPNNEPIGKGGQNSAVTPQQSPAAPPQQRIRPAPQPAQPPQDWGAPPPSSGWAQDIQSPSDTPPAAPPPYGYDQAPEQQQPQQFGYAQPPQATPAFGYEQSAGEAPAAASPAEFGYDQSAPGAEPTPWNSVAGPSSGFGLSGLNPFAPPEETAGSAPTPEMQPDFASQFKDDIAKGLAGEGAIRFEESQMAQANENKWTLDTPTDFTQEAQKFAPPPDHPFGSSIQQYAAEQFPAPTSFDEQQFGNDHFKTPDFGAPADLGPVNADLNAPPQEVFSSFPPIPPANLASDDVFQPPYAGATSTGEFELPTELTSKLDPQNQLFQAPGSEDQTSSRANIAAVPAPQAMSAPQSTSAPQAMSAPQAAPTPPAVPEVNFGFDAFNQQPPSEFTDSIFDATSGAFEKTSRAMSFDEEIEEQSASASAAAQAQSTSSANLPAQNWAMPSDDWAQAQPPASEWGSEQKPTTPSDEQPWSPEPGASGWAPEPVAAAETPPPTWNFDGAAQAPAWTPEKSDSEPAPAPVSWVTPAKPVDTPAPAQPTAPEAEDDDDEEASDGTPSLFDRLNQQLQKGSTAEVEPPRATPDSSQEAAAASAKNSAQGAAPHGTPAVEGLSAETIAAASEAIPTSEYASTPLPPPVTQPEEPAAPTAPLPLGVSKKNAPLILDWPSPADALAAETADNLPSVPASGVPSLGSGGFASAATEGQTHLPLSAASDLGTTVQPAAFENAPPSFEMPSQSSEASGIEAPSFQTKAPSLEAPETTPQLASTQDASGSTAASHPDTGAGGGIKHLAEALSGLMENEEPHPISPFANIKPPAFEAPAPTPPPVTPVEAAPVQSVIEEPVAAHVEQPVTEAPEAQAAIVEAPVAQPVEQPVVQPEPPVEEEVEEEEELSPSAVLAAKGFQEPRLVMNEMNSLMSKLEQQVQKAAKRLNSRAEEIKQRLLAQVDSLVADCTQIEKESQRSTTNLSQRLIKQLDDVCEESRLKVSDVAANGRYTIKQLLTSNQTNVDETKNTLYESLREACKQFRIETEALARTAETDLNELVNTRTEELNQLVKEMNAHLDDTNSNYIEKLNARFERFKERMSEEASSVIRSLERNVRSMVEEIDGSWDRASDKLKTSKSDFEQTIQHSVKTAELNLSQSTRLILTNALIPKLRERQQVLRVTSVELSKRFSDESERQVSGQILGLEASLGAARQQLQTLVDDCMSSIDSVGRGQQAGLEDIFKETCAHAERATTEVTEFLNKIETQINENEQTCKRLAEQSSLDNDPELSTDRNEAMQRVQQLRQQANTELTNAIDHGCAKLELLSNNIQSEVSAMRVEQTQAVRDAAENGLTRVRDAIQEAFNAIQAAREKYME